MGDILGAIANPDFSDLNKAIDYRQQQVNDDAAKRKQIITDSLVGKALSSGLQDGTPLSDLAKQNPNAFVGLSKVMGFDPSDGAGLHQLTQDVSHINALSLAHNPQAVMDYMTHAKDARDKLGLNTAALTQGIQSMQEDPDKFLRANSALNQALNPDQVAAQAKVKQEADLAERGMQVKEQDAQAQQKRWQFMSEHERAQDEHWRALEGKNAGIPGYTQPNQPGATPPSSPADVEKKPTQPAIAPIGSTPFDTDAQNYRLTGKLESGLTGTAGTAYKLQVKNRANQLDQLEGISPTDSADTRMQNAQNSIASQKIVNDLSGKTSPLIPINKMMDHIDSFEHAFSAMNNGETPIANKIANLWGKSIGHPEVTTVEAMAKPLADEIAKSNVGGQTAAADRDEYIKILRSDASPEQITQAIDGLREMGMGALHAQKTNYESNPILKKRGDFNQRFLSDSLRNQYEKTANEKGWNKSTQKTDSGSQPSLDDLLSKY